MYYKGIKLGEKRGCGTCTFSLSLCPGGPKLGIHFRGVDRIFQRGVTLCQNEGTHQIVMSFSSPVVGCLLKIWLRKGGGVIGTPGPPSNAPAFCTHCTSRIGILVKRLKSDFATLLVQHKLRYRGREVKLSSSLTHS